MILGQHEPDRHGREDTAVTSPFSRPACPRAGRYEARLVLIVDDNEKNLKLARDVLRAAGFRTIEAAKRRRGIALAAEHQPDVILMDLRLPDMDGADAARTLARRARTAAIPVVALSSLPLERRDAWILGNAGFAGYLEKPFNVGEFLEQVRRLLHWRRPGAVTVLPPRRWRVSLRRPRRRTWHVQRM